MFQDTGQLSLDLQTTLTPVHPMHGIIKTILIPQSGLIYLLIFGKVTGQKIKLSNQPSPSSKQKNNCCN
jgi:hypothetical protein